jgi:hypothetical protein
MQRAAPLIVRRYQLHTWKVFCSIQTWSYSTSDQKCNSRMPYAPFSVILDTRDVPATAEKLHVGLARVGGHELTVSSRLYLPNAAGQRLSFHLDSPVLAKHSHRITIGIKPPPSRCGTGLDVKSVTTL